MSNLGKTVTICKEIEFDAGHRVPNHRSKCRNPHGHRYRVVVHCRGKVVEEAGASDQGMLIDFGDLKDLLIKQVHDPLDHGFIVWEDDGDLLQAFMWWDPTHIPSEIHDRMDPVWKIIKFPYIPTAENIAIWVWEQLDYSISNHWRGNLTLEMVEVWETPTSVAYYEGDNNVASE